MNRPASHAIDQLLQQGLAAHQGGDLVTAERIYQQVLAQQPKHGQALYLLGAMYAQHGDPNTAIQLLTKVLKVAPKNVAAQDVMGVALRRDGQLEKAADCHRRASQLNPKAPAPLNNLGVVLQELGDLAGASDAYQRALAIQPDNLLAQSNLATIRARLGDKDGAEACLKRILELTPEQIAPRYNLASLWIGVGRFEEAAEIYRQLLAEHPDEMDALAGLADVLQRQGQKEAAYELLAPMLTPQDGAPVHPRVAATFADLAPKVKQEAKAVTLLSGLLAGNLPDGDAVQLGFSLGRLQDKLGQYDDAFRHYHDANRRVARSMPFAPEVHDQQLQTLLRNFASFDGLQTADNDSEVPLFIVGMPRSGTSLVEQILSAHPHLHGAGELNLISSLAATLPGPYPDGAKRLKRPALSKAANEYIGFLTGQGGDALRVTDKLPHNFFYLGLIALLFPRARVIHCLRDPVDTCLSCYFQMFSGTHDYCYDLAHLGGYYRQYEQIMAHWKAVLPLPILEVQYEQLVADPEPLSREMIEFVGLEWDDACLRPHENKRQVTTASFDQVRQPIYQKSAGRWRHYERHLGPLLKALGQG